MNAGNLPSIEAIESRHSFPGPYLFKVIGIAEGGFVSRVVSTVREELALPEDPPFTLRQTKGGKHVSVSIEPDVADAEQVLKLYSLLQNMAGLIMLM